MNPVYKHIAIAGIAVAGVLLGAGAAGAFEEAQALAAAAAPNVAVERYDAAATERVEPTVAAALEAGPVAVGAELEALLASGDDPIIATRVDHQIGAAL